MAKKAELKTKQNAASVDQFLAGIPDDGQRADCLAVAKLMKKAAKAEPAMWGSSIVGFGSRHLKYASGRELDWFWVGFSPRKDTLTLYGLEKHAPLLKNLGKHKISGSCLHVKRLADVDLDVLRQIVEKSISAAKK